MTSTCYYEDAVSNFDLNFFRQTTTNNMTDLNIIAKQKRSVAILKNKIIGVNKLIGIFNAKSQELKETHKNLSASKEECKQICIDYTKSLETCAKLESEIEKIQISKKQLELNCFNAENQYEATQSHLNQLQALSSNNKKTIATLEDENKSQKVIIRNCNKKYQHLLKENKTLLKHIHLFKDIILGKRKYKNRYKPILELYKRNTNNKSDDESSESDNSVIEDDIFEDVMSPYNESNNTSEIKKAIGSKYETPMELDNDCSNEIVSIDTGRGSSLAFSDAEKCFHSPDYYSDDSPLSREIAESKVKTKLVDSTTSPLPVRTMVEAATSPIPAIEEQTVVCQIIIEDEELRNSITSCIETSQVHQDDRLVSPPKFNLNDSGRTSPMNNVETPVATSPTKVSSPATHKQYKQKTTQEQECLQINNSHNYLEENSNDFEIETILNTMRFNLNMLTPIPPTPLKTRGSDREGVLKQTNLTSHECQDAAQVREEHIKMRATIADLGKEMVDVKSLLKNQLLFFKKMFAHKGMDSVIPHKSLAVDNNEENDEDNCGQDIIHDNNNVDNGIHSPIPEDPIIIPRPDSELVQLTDLSLPEPSAILETLDETTCDTIILDNNFVEHEPPKQILDRLEFEEPVILPSVKNTSIDKSKTSNSADSTIDDLNNDINREVELAKEKYDKIKNRKLTKLEKLKQKLVPKCKIKSDVSRVSKKIRLKPKRLLASKPIAKASTADTSATLNDKDVYEKAVKVMAELNAKQTDEPNVSSKKDDVTNSLDDIISIERNDTPVDDIKLSSVTTRSRAKFKEQNETRKTDEARSEEKIGPRSDITTEVPVIPHNSSIALNLKPNEKVDKPPITAPIITRKRIRESISESSDIQCKRILRSSAIRDSISDNKAPHITKVHESGASSSNPSMEAIEPINKAPRDTQSNKHDCKTLKSPMKAIEPISKELNHPVPNKNVNRRQTTKQVDDHSNAIAYDDLDIFTDETPKTKSEGYELSLHPKDSILGVSVHKYGIRSVKVFPKKIPDATTKLICDKIESEIAKIIELPPTETKNAMNKLVADIQKYNYKHFMTGFMKYLKDPERKAELFGKIVAPPAPSMTKSEQVLLYVISQLRSSWDNVDIVEEVLCNIEYALFKLNHSPQFDTIESMSHFYAVLCRYINAKSRLRIFILDAMYCLQFKSVPLIKQCLDAWLHIIPLAHMGLAKSPLVTCLVFLLHFYKCEDKFNRVQEIRNILHRKYFYQITEWNETKILEMFKSAIMDIRDVAIERKMLRLALIILAKRQGPRWCQNNLIKNMLQPLIEKKDVPEPVREFCVTMIGPLMKPYSVEMKVHCEIAVNLLIDIWNNNPSHRMTEAVIASLVCISKHSYHLVNKTLLTRKLDHISPECENILRDFVREKPLKVWKTVFTKTRLQ